MPSNSAEYQKEYRKRTARKRKEVSVSLAIDDYRELKAYAASQGFGLSTVLREATLLQIRGSQLRSKAVEAELKELRFLLSNIANNVNQMARHSNRVKHVADEGGLFRKLQQLETTLDDFTSSRMNDTE